MDWNQIEICLRNAIRKLRKKDSDLLQTLVNERSLTHRLGIYLEEEVNQVEPNVWHVDCEYNRYLDETKRLVVDPEPTNSADLQAVTVYPDIIVHKRMNSGRANNLLVIEAKKGNEPSARDTGKLEGFVRAGNHYEYQFGMFLGFDEIGLQRAILYTDGNEPRDSQKDRELREFVKGCNE